MQDRTGTGIYYGWWILCATAFTEMLALGSTTYAAGLFVQPLEAEFGFTRAAASSSVSISFIGAALMAPLVGYLLDRYSVRYVMTCGGVALGLGFAVISMTSFVPLMILALLVPIAFGGMAIGPLTTSTLTSRWFYRRRGRALGFASVATSGGGIFVAPLLAIGIEAFGWRNALLIEALLIVSIVLSLAALVIRGTPAELGLETHSENEGRPLADLPGALAGAEAAVAGWRYRDILGTLEFWAVAIIIASISGINQAVVVSIVPYATQLGVSPPSAAFLVSSFAVFAAFVKVASGFLSEFIDRRLILLAGALFMASSLVIFLFFDSYPLLFAACCLAGAGLGCTLPTATAQIAAFFGAPSFGKVMGMIYVAVVVLSVVSLYVAGLIYDRTGSYDGAFILFLAATGAAAVATLCIRSSQPQAARRTLTDQA